MKKFKRAVTDSEVRGPLRRRRQARGQRTARHPGRGDRHDATGRGRGYTQYGPLKVDTGEAVVAMLEPIQARYHELIGDPAELDPTAADRLGRARTDRRRPPCSACTTRSGSSRRDSSRRSTGGSSASPSPRWGRWRSSRSTSSSTPRSSDSSAPISSPVWRSPRRCCRSSSPAPTSSPTARPSGSPDASVPATAPPRPTSGSRRCGCRCCSACRPLPCCSSAPARCPAGSVPRARCSNTPRRICRSAPSGCRSSWSRWPRRACCGAPRTTRRRSGCCSCANVANLLIELVFVFVFDMGVAGSAWSTVDRPDRRRRCLPLDPATRNWAGIDPAARPERDAPLMSAGKYLLLRVGSMLGVFGGSTAIAARIDERHARRPSGREQPLHLPGARRSMRWRFPPKRSWPRNSAGTTCRRPPMSPDEPSDCRCGPAPCSASARGRTAPVLPHLFTRRPGRRSAGRQCASGGCPCIMLPGAVAFAHDGILIGAGDYRFLGRAAFGYLVAVSRSPC